MISERVVVLYDKIVSECEYQWLMEMSAVISNFYFSKTQQVLAQSSGHFLRASGGA